jgi:hypothetical protein
MMRIRDATIDDRDRLIGFVAAAHDEPAPVRTIDRVLQFGHCLIAENEDGIAAYAILEYTFFELGFLSMLYVDHRFRRQGIARAEAAASRCSTERLFTSTNRSNAAMRALLADLQYVPSGEIENLDPGDPELFFFLQREGGAA